MAFDLHFMQISTPCDHDEILLLSNQISHDEALDGL